MVAMRCLERRAEKRAGPSPVLRTIKVAINFSKKIAVG